ncbi:hypothetical protein AYK21_01085 [Thermoplasmatales archaeon SG8-52-2]|nr:MAG: hypothetical protein AYK21_01085 [Thermoplasmatales archaeon SG8-52-2]
MNRESLPLIFTMLVPIVLVLIVLLYYYGYDITEFFRTLNVLYYIVFIPIVLGFIVAIIKYMRPD